MSVIKMAKKNIQPPTNRWVIAIIVLLVLGIFSLFAAGIMGLFISTAGDFEQGNVALIEIKGFITVDAPTSLVGPEFAKSSEIVDLIEQADADPEITAIVLDINSGGGSPVASIEIAEAIQKTNKTVVAWIREVGASGAYWIASSSDYIVANSLSITGSIAAISSYLDFSQFITDHNVSYQRLVSGKYKDMGVPFKELTPEERDLFQETLDTIHAEFVNAVAENRGIPVEDISELATGQIYLGRKAKDLGLIDKVGGKDDVVAYIEDKHEIEADIVEFKKRKTFADLLEDVFVSQSFSLGLGMGKGIEDTVSVRT
jgi:protease-4